MPEHSALPWVVDDGGDGEHEIWSPDSGTLDAVCFVGTSEDLHDEQAHTRHAANSHLIVTAVNNHADLVQTLRNLYNVAALAWNNGAWTGNESSDEQDSSDEALTVIEDARELLKKLDQEEEKD